MITRYRFLTDGADFRPVKFPPPGPYWCSGYSGIDGRAIIVAFLPASADLKEWWPDADCVDADEPTRFLFSGRFPRPEWWDATTSPWHEYRVWPDGTVQAVEDGEPYAWMSDDYRLVWAEDEAGAGAAA